MWHDDIFSQRNKATKKTGRWNGIGQNLKNVL